MKFASRVVCGDADDARCKLKLWGERRRLKKESVVLCNRYSKKNNVQYPNPQSNPIFQVSMEMEYGTSPAPTRHQSTLSLIQADEMPFSACHLLLDGKRRKMQFSQKMYIT